MKTKLKTENIVTCTLYVIVGALLCIYKSGVLNILMTVIGALMIVYGVYEVAMHNTLPGAIEIALGVALIVCGWTIATYVLLVLGILLAVKGVIDIYELIKSKSKNTTAWITAAVMIVVGVVLCVSPFALTDTLILIVGIVLIVEGILSLFNN